MSTSAQWQLAREAAERYEGILIPPILGPFAHALVEWSGIREGDTVLDVGCGTGSAARYAAERTGESGRIIGLDVNAGMLEVARSISTERSDSIEWLEGNASQLLVDDQTIDVALCAQTLQFLPERQKALSEMRRVLKPNGRMAVSLWCDLEENPYFHTLVESVTEHIGPDTAIGLKAAFALTSPGEIRALIADMGFEKVSMAVKQIDLELPELNEFVPRHVSATPMAAGFHSASPELRNTVIKDVADKLSPFTTGTGVQIPFRSHLTLAEK